MKLRIHGNTVRLRLSQSEVARFAAEGRVEDRLELGGSALVYALEASPDVGSPRAVLENCRLVAIVPVDVGRKWAEGDEVGIEGERLVIEKDFRCLHGPSVEDPDAFPNPLALTS